MVDVDQVKGSAFKSKFDYVREHHGEDAYERLKAQLEGKSLFPILEGAWYPAPLYEELHCLIADQCFGGDLDQLAELGVESAKIVLEGVHRAFARSGDTQRLLDILPTFHSRVYSTGIITLEGRNGDAEILIRLSGIPAYLEASMMQAAGFFAGLFRYIGHSHATCVMRREGNAALFTLRLDG